MGEEFLGDVGGSAGEFSSFLLTYSFTFSLGLSVYSMFGLKRGRDGDGDGDWLCDVDVMLLCCRVRINVVRPTSLASCFEPPGGSRMFSGRERRCSSSPSSSCSMCGSFIH